MSLGLIFILSSGLKIWGFSTLDLHDSSVGQEANCLG